MTVVRKLAGANIASALPLLCCLSCSYLNAQEPQTAGIQGIVRENNGMIVEHALVTATSPASTLLTFPSIIFRGLVRAPIILSKITGKYRCCTRVTLSAEHIAPASRFFFLPTPGGFLTSCLTLDRPGTMALTRPRREIHCRRTL